MHFDRLLAHVKAASPRAAFRHGDRVLSWAELDRLSRAWAARLLAGGLAAGDRVAVLAPTSLELMVALVGHHRAGLIHVPINTRYREREIAHILQDSGAKLLLTDDGAAPLATDVPVMALAAALEPSADAPEPSWAPDDEAIALLIYTSGTTGRSKGVRLSFRAVGAGIGALTELWRWSADDKLVLALPLFHVHGLCIGVHGTLLHGLEAELQARFEPGAVVAAIGQRGGTIFMGVPTMHRRLLEHLDAHPAGAAALRSARLFTSGSAALPAADFERFEALTGHRIVERYGMTETLLTLSNPYDGPRRPGTVGLPVPGAEVTLFDGEIAVRGPSLMSGYHGLPQATAAAYRDGWFLTGDAATRDDDGYLRIVGRRSVDVLKSGGFKISAREIEEVLQEHPAVAEVAVVGLPDATWGQLIAAAIVRAPGAPEDPSEALEAWCSAELADYKRPRRWTFVDALPRNALGKLQKHRIIAALAEQTP